jgi:hypothetical protein
MTTVARYCARRTCSKVLVRRAQESSAQFAARKFCSVSHASRTLNRGAKHGTWAAVRIHWLRAEQYCRRCLVIVNRERAKAGI